MDLEQAIELHRLPSLHQFPSTENDEVVRNERDGRLLHCRHGRLAGHEAEVICWVSAHQLEGLVEDGPEGDAEGPVEAGRSVDEPDRFRAHLCGCISSSLCVVVNYGLC